MPTESEDRRLPTESQSQRIGKEAVSAFTARHPTSWNVRLLDGGDDYGIDAQAQVADQEGKIVGLFHAQIKGSRTSQLNSAGDQISVPLSITTLNYYARIDSPIMLVFSDLSVEEDPRSCPVYWTWLTEDIRGLLAGRPDFSDFQQNTLTFHVPVANKLERDFDITDELLRFRHRSNALTRLWQTVSEYAEPDVPLPDAIGKLTQAIETRGSQLLTTLSASAESPWIEPPKGTVAASLRDCQVLMARNDDSRAENLLDSLKERIEGEGTNVEKAEFEYLCGRICSIRKEHSETIGHYETAVGLNASSSKYLAALVESKLIVEFPRNPEVVKSLIEEIQDSDEESIICIRARLQAAVGEIQTALDSLSGCESFPCSVARALVLYLDKNWEALIEVCQSGLGKPEIQLGEQCLFTLLLARAHFYRGVGAAALETDGRISPSGNPDMQFDELWLAWGFAKAALEFFRQANWPANVEHLLDVISTLSLALNKQHEVLSDLEDLSARRPQFHFAHETLHRVAALAGNETLALEALDRLPDTPDNLHFRILTLHSAKQYQQTLDLAEERLVSSDKDHELRGACLGTAALTAYELMRPDRAAPFETALNEEVNLAGDAAVFKYFHSILENPLSQPSAAMDLYNAFIADPKSVIIQDNLFPALNARDSDGAARCIELSKAVVARRRLALPEVMRLGQAYVTQHDWDALRALVVTAIKQYGSLPSLLSLRALALEGMGDAAGALEILGEILAGSPSEELAIDSYINICARNGFQEEALGQLEKLLQQTTDKSQQLGYLQQIWGLEMASRPDNPRLFDIALRYGALCDQDVEEQEGIFLQMFLMSTLREEVEVSKDKEEEFRARVENFFQKFPNSSVLKRVELPANQTGESFKNSLSSALGYTEEAERWFSRVENQLQRGELAVPYCWLPRKLLRNIPDIAYLWAIAKTSSKDAHAFHLTLARDPEYQGADLRHGPGQIPILDITALIVLHELNLLDTAFEILQRVGVGKRTLLEIQRLSHPFFGGHSNIVAISKYLQNNFSRMVQPGNPCSQVDEKSTLDASLEEIKELAGAGDYSLYIDDQRAREYIELDHSGIPTITTIDILIEAERRGILTAAEVSKKLAKLIACNVIIPIKGKYFLAAIPTEVGGIEDVHRLLDILRNDDTFSLIANGVWDIRKGYQSTIGHVASQLAYIAINHAAKVELLAAVWETWLASVKFRADLKYTELEHAANCLVFAAAIARSDSVAIKRLWDAYILIVQLVYGDRMDERSEAQSRVLVGQVTARIAQEREPEFRDTISNIMASGLEKETYEYDRFLEGYRNERIRLGTERAGE